MDTRSIQPGKCLGQKICLLLVIPFQANPVACFQYRMQAVAYALLRKEFALQIIAQHVGRHVVATRSDGANGACSRRVDVVYCGAPRPRGGTQARRRDAAG